MAGNPRLKVEFELTAKQKKILGYVLSREKVPAAEVCRRLLVNYLNILRDAAMTGVLPRVPQEPKPLSPPRPGRKTVPAEILRGAEQFRLVWPWLGGGGASRRAGVGARTRDRRVSRPRRRKKAASGRRRRR